MKRFNRNFQYQNLLLGQDFKKQNLPDTPGVYFFTRRGTTRDERGSSRKREEILYIGKATSLRDRVKSYFSNDLIATRGPLIVDMVFKADKITFQKTDSVLEALILETELIKKHKPKYNTKEKDDKSYNFVVITKEDYPRVLIKRGKDLAGGKRFDLKSGERSKLEEPAQRIFGPFPHSTQLKEAVKIVRKIFPFRDKCKPVEAHHGELQKGCFNYQIRLCPGVCVGLISKTDYEKIIKNIILFFEGKKTKIIKNLEKEMGRLAKNQQFEKAGEIKKTIFALNHIQDVALIKKDNEASREKNPDVSVIASEAWQSSSGLLREDPRKDGGVIRIEAYDIAHISGTANVGVMVVLENGEPAKSEYRKFKIKESKQNDIAGLKEILERRLAHEEWAFPQIIVVDGGKAQIKIAREVVSPLLGYRIAKLAVVSVVKDERHRPKAILGDKNITSKYSNEFLLANSEAHRFAIKYHRKTLSKKSLI